MIGSRLSVEMPGDDEHILSMRKFKGMTKSIICRDKSIEIAFYDDNTFEYAKKVWDWVNGADNHTFVMVADPRDCGWNDHRVPFLISTLDYNESANVALLAAERSNWATAAHTYDLVIGSVPGHEFHPQHQPTEEGSQEPDVALNPLVVTSTSQSYWRSAMTTSMPIPTPCEVRKRCVNNIWDKFKDKVEDIVEPIKDKVEDIVEPIKDKVEDVVEPIKDKVEDVLEPIKDKVEDVVEPIKSAVGKVKDKVKTKLKKVGAKLAGKLGKLIGEKGPFHLDLSGIKSTRQTLKIGTDDLFTRIALNNFATHGELEFGIHAVQDKSGDRTKLKAYIQPNKVSVSVDARIQIGTTFGGSYKQEVKAVTPPLTPIHVPGLFSLGPELAALVRFSVGPIEATAEVVAPIKVSIEDGAKLEIDLSGGTDNIINKEGSWKPHFDIEYVALTGRLCGDVTAKAQVRADFKLKLFESVDAVGFGIGIGPYVTERFEAIVSTHEGCNKKDTPNKMFSLMATTLVGLEIRPEVKVVDEQMVDINLSVSIMLCSQGQISPC
jgi:gas vesicle protein